MTTIYEFEDGGKIIFVYRKYQVIINVVHESSAVAEFVYQMMKRNIWSIK